jgi:predicted RNase H-like HicB family nuclease
MKHQVWLVTYGGYLHAWVLDLPGCVTGAHDMDELAQALPVVIAEHVAWLREHGEVVEERDGWEVAETVDGRRLDAIGGEFCFAGERVPLAPEELEGLIARMQHARADLLGSVEPLPDAVLDWEPPPFAVASVDAWAPEVRTIRAIIEHVLQLELYYRDGLHDRPAKGIFERVENADSERARTIELLRSLPDEERGRAYWPVRPSRTVAEEWSVRKVIRRIISHERAHTAEVQQRRTWLLLGVPRLRDG